MSITEIKKLIAQCCLLDARFYCPHSVKGCGCETPMLELPNAWLDLIKKYDVAGFIWFKENLAAVTQIQTLNQQVKLAFKSQGYDAPIISVDQEGGRVSRTPLNETTTFAGNMALGASRNLSLCEHVTQQICGELSTLGFNTNYAPCVDVNSNPRNPVINVRSFGESADLVSDMGLAVCRAMRRSGVVNSIKHFPGHGDADMDSHIGLPVIHRTLEEVTKVELAPFKTLIDADVVDSVMVAHIQVPALDDSIMSLDSGKRVMTPATFSKPMIQGYLKGALGWQGVVISDALDMGAIANLCQPTEAAYRALSAGIDLLMMPIRMHSESSLRAFDGFLDSVARRIQKKASLVEQLIESAAKVSQLRIRLNESSSLSTNLRSPSALKLERELIENSLVCMDEFTHLKPGESLNLWSSIPGTAALFRQEFELKGVNCVVLDSLDDADKKPLLVITQSPVENAVDDGRPDGLALQAHDTYAPSDIQRVLENLDASYWLSTRAPYELSWAPKRTARFASFNYKTGIDVNGRATSPLYEYFVGVLMGEQSTKGRMPVSIDP